MSNDLGNLLPSSDDDSLVDIAQETSLTPKKEFFNLSSFSTSLTLLTLPLILTIFYFQIETNNPNIIERHINYPFPWTHVNKNMTVWTNLTDLPNFGISVTMNAKFHRKNTISKPRKNISYILEVNYLSDFDKVVRNETFPLELTFDFQAGTEFTSDFELARVFTSRHKIILLKYLFLDDLDGIDGVAIDTVSSDTISLAKFETICKAMLIAVGYTLLRFIPRLIKQSSLSQLLLLVSLFAFVFPFNSYLSIPFCKLYKIEYVIGLLTFALYKTVVPLLIRKLQTTNLYRKYTNFLMIITIISLIIDLASFNMWWANDLALLTHLSNDSPMKTIRIVANMIYILGYIVFAVMIIVETAQKVDSAVFSFVSIIPYYFDFMHKFYYVPPLLPTETTYKSMMQMIAYTFASLVLILAFDKPDAEYRPLDKQEFMDDVLEED